MASPMVPNENSIARTSGTTGQGKGRPPLKLHRLSSRGNAELGHTHGELEALADALFGYRTGTVSLASTGLRTSCTGRSAVRRVGREGVRTCRRGGWRYRRKQKKTT